MGKCYCDYCDVFLTNDSVAVRKQHNDGNRHKYNVCEYYRQHIGNKLQEQIDLIVESFEQRVAQGLIRPTYALPTPKLIPQTQQDDDADNNNDNADKGQADEHQNKQPKEQTVEPGNEQSAQQSPPSDQNPSQPAPVPNALQT